MVGRNRRAPLKQEVAPDNVVLLSFATESKHIVTVNVRVCYWTRETGAGAPKVDRKAGALINKKTDGWKETGSDANGLANLGLNTWANRCVKRD